MPPSGNGKKLSLPLLLPPSPSFSLPPRPSPSLPLLLPPSPSNLAVHAAESSYSAGRHAVTMAGGVCYPRIHNVCRRVSYLFLNSSPSLENGYVDLALFQTYPGSQIILFTKRERKKEKRSLGNSHDRI